MSNSETCRKVKFDKLDSNVQNLIRESVKVRQNAYCPYSNFKVGAALLTDSGLIHKGVNVENISYGLGICAERSAVASAVSSGESKIKMIAVCADSESGPVPPCGACREFIAEFSKNKDIPIYLSDSKLDSVFETSIRQLLPFIFVGFNDLQVFTGCNIENAAFSATICAERAAIVKSISAGQSNFVAIAVCADPEGGIISPCGLCRQFILEFAKNDIAIYLCNSSMDKIVQTSIQELLPMSFSTM